MGKGREASVRRQGMGNDGLPVEGLGVIRLRRAAQQIWPWRRWESSRPVRPQFTVKLGKTKKYLALQAVVQLLTLGLI